MTASENANLVHIPFHGDDILSIRDERTGKEYVLPKHTAVHVFGLSWPSQHRKLTQNSDFSRGIINMIIPTTQGDQETLLLERKYFHAWLMSIDSRRIKDEGIRGRLQAYKDEATEALDAYWTKGIAIAPHAEEHPLIAQARLVLAQAEHIARVEAKANAADKRAERAEMKSDMALQDAHYLTLEEFIIGQKLLRQFPKNTWNAAGKWLAKFCEQWNLRILPKGTPWKPWKEENAYPLQALGAWVDYEMRKRGQIRLEGIEEDGLQYGLEEGD